MAQEASEQAKPAKKKGKLPLILGVVGVLALGGGGAAWWFMRPAPAAADEQEEETKEAHEEGGGVVSFEPFVVNLADEGGGRFLRATVQIVVADAELAKEISENAVKMVRLRSNLLELLAEQTSDALITAEGKNALKDAIAERAAEVLAPHEVSDVLFSDFLVQF
jgi:flagellar FliL protein